MRRAYTASVASRPRSPKAGGGQRSCQPLPCSLGSGSRGLASRTMPPVARGCIRCSNRPRSRSACAAVGLRLLAARRGPTRLCRSFEACRFRAAQGAPAIGFRVRCTPGIPGSRFAELTAAPLLMSGGKVRLQCFGLTVRVVPVGTGLFRAQGRAPWESPCRDPSLSRSPP